MREKARRIPGIGTILDRVNSNFKSLEIDIFKDQQGDLCIYSILSKGNMKKGCKDSQEPHIMSILWAIIKIFFMLFCIN